MVSIVAFGQVAPALEPSFSPSALLQIVDPVIYELDAATACMVDILNDEEAEACALFGGYRRLADAIAAVTDQTDRMEIELIAEQLPAGHREVGPDAAFQLERLATAHAEIESALEGAGSAALKGVLIRRRTALRASARSLAMALAASAFASV